MIRLPKAFYSSIQDHRMHSLGSILCINYEVTFQKSNLWHNMSNFHTSCCTPPGHCAVCAPQLPTREWRHLWTPHPGTEGGEWLPRAQRAQPLDGGRGNLCQAVRNSARGQRGVTGRIIAPPGDEEQPRNPSPLLKGRGAALEI